MEIQITQQMLHNIFPKKSCFKLHQYVILLKLIFFFLVSSY